MLLHVENGMQHGQCSWPGMCPQPACKGLRCPRKESYPGKQDQERTSPGIQGSAVSRRHAVMHSLPVRKAPAPLTGQGTETLWLLICTHPGHCTSHPSLDSAVADLLCGTGRELPSLRNLYLSPEPGLSCDTPAGLPTFHEAALSAVLQGLLMAQPERAPNHCRRDRKPAASFFILLSRLRGRQLCHSVLGPLAQKS